MPNSAAAA
jgi:putative transposase